MQAAKGKYEGEQKTANSSSMELGGDKDFPYDINLEGITAEDHEGNSFRLGNYSLFSEDSAEWKALVQTYAGTLRRETLNKIQTH